MVPVVSYSGYTANHDPDEAQNMNKSKQQRKLFNPFLHIPHQHTATKNGAHYMPTRKTSSCFKKKIFGLIKICAFKIRADISAGCAIFS